jgi:glycosyltransferase involved in cell wall biosynthesis
LALIVSQTGSFIIVTDKTATVVIPTIGYRAGGKDTITQAIDSVIEQSYQRVRPHVFLDGPDADYQYRLGSTNIPVTRLSENTGRVGAERYWGHRIYAASAHLVNSDYVLFLDDDNWYEPYHVESLIELCERKDLHFAFSLRNIYGAEDKFLCKDRCESLGMHAVWGEPIRGYHVDTSAYCFRRDFLIQFGSYWHGGYAQDRKFFNTVRAIEGIRYGTTGLFTLNYRLGSTETSAVPDFFKFGNEKTKGWFESREETNAG